MDATTNDARPYWRSAECGGMTLCAGCGLRAAVHYRRHGMPQRAPFLVDTDSPTYGTHSQICGSCGRVAHDAPGMHWHYEYGIGGYMPETVYCLHDGSRSDALEYLRDEVRRYVDEYGVWHDDDSAECECRECAIPDRYTPTEHAESVAYGIADSELGDMPEWVTLNEYDYARICLVPNDGCECYRDYVADPIRHECFD